MINKKNFFLFPAVFLFWVLAGTGEKSVARGKQDVTGKSNLKTVIFQDVTRKAGIRFKHENGGSGHYYYPETFGSGVCVIDYNRDGNQDLLFIDGTKTFPKDPTQKSTDSKYESVRLYRNNGDGTFSDQTKFSGLSVSFYGMGCSIGDYDNDGFHDIFLTGYGAQFLFRNEENGQFRDVTRKAKLYSSYSNQGSHPEIKEIPWSTSTLWFDYDRDGHLDLFVGHYVQWTLEGDLWCTIDGKSKSFCGPEPYRGQTNRLYRNRGNGTFEDVTNQSGILNTNGKTLGVAMLDVNEDSWPDLVIANDMVPNFLFVNLGDGRFKNEAVKRGLSTSETGLAKAGMGIDTSDFQNNHGLGILIGNFAHEQLSLYVRRKEGIFLDESPRLGTGIPSHYFLTFGLFFFDFDLDGFLDIFTANGHVDRNAPLITKGTAFQQRPLLFKHGNEKVYEEVGLKTGRHFSEPVVGRGAAYLDYDRDGDLDIILTENNGRAKLFRNEGGNQNNWLRVKLVGKKSNRDAIGSVVEVKVGSQILRSKVKSGSSYLSQSELPLTFGLDKEKEAEWLKIQWPSGLVEKYSGLKGNQSYVFVEGSQKNKRKP